MNFNPFFGGEQLENKAMAVADQTPVHCHQCSWYGYAHQLKPVYKPNPLQPGDVTPVASCPACLSDQQLEYKEVDDGS